MVPQPLNANPYPDVMMTASQKSSKKSENEVLKAEQHAMQQAYIKSTPEEKRNGKFFKDLPIENMIDHEAIAYAR